MSEVTKLAEHILEVIGEPSEPPTAPAIALRPETEICAHASNAIYSLPEKPVAVKGKTFFLPEITKKNHQLLTVY